SCAISVPDRNDAQSAPSASFFTTVVPPSSCWVCSDNEADSIRADSALPAGPARPRRGRGAARAAPRDDVELLRRALIPLGALTPLAGLIPLATLIALAALITLAAAEVRLQQVREGVHVAQLAVLHAEEVRIGRAAA